MNIAVLGAGAWGTAIAAHLSARHATTLWARDAALVQRMALERENAKYLRDCPLPEALRLEADFSAALAQGAGADDLVVAATPVAGLRELLEAMRGAGVPRNLIWLCKGLEAETHALPHQIVAEVLQGEAVRYGVVSGPSFALEVARGLPVALIAASTHAQLRERAVEAFHFGPLRLYTGEDLIGVEVGGAVKNVLAIAIGIADGSGLGMNARAALITRGLAEMTRLGVALGARAETFTGLSGIGDLILTATGDLSRNRTVGVQLAHGAALDSVLGGLGHVAEGVRCAAAVAALGARLGVEMPITRAVCAILFEGSAVGAAVRGLLARDVKDEA